MAAASILSARDVAFSYGDRQVVSGFDLEVEAGSFVCLVGRTGSAKSTIAKLLAGILRPEHGEVLFAGGPVAAARDAVAFVFQGDSLLPWRTVAENVALSFELGAAQGGRGAAPARVETLLRSVGLAGYEGYYPSQISGGMRQRTAVARAFATSAPVLVMDEPFGSVDVHTRQLLEQELLRLWEQDRRTVVFVTNDHDEALVLADRIVAIAGAPATDVAELAVELPRPRSLLGDDVLALRPRVRGLDAAGVAR
jgi:NitT/TauT family transport system ATP-binding protein